MQGAKDTLYGIMPCQKTSGTACASLPASKSSLNRLLVLGALSPQKVTLRASNWGEDTDLMLDALRALGFRIDIDAPKSHIHIHGEGGRIPNPGAKLYCGNAGTVARFVSALLALHPKGRYTLDGSAAMRKRPVAHLWEALQAVGAIQVEYLGEAGCLPCVLHTQGFRASTITIDTRSSSQGLSALMLIGSLKGLRIDVLGDTPSWPFVEMTAQLMTSAGGKVQLSRKKICVERAVYTWSYPYTVPLDATAASYYAAWAISTQKPICIRPFVRDTEQGDWAFLDLLERLGLIRCAMKKGSVESLKITPHTICRPIEADFRAISDTFLTLLAIGPLLKVPIKLYGLRHTRFQECDRLAAMAYNLRQLNQTVNETEDGIELWPNYEALKSVSSYTIEDYQDHRVAMSFAVLASHCLTPDKQPWIYLKHPGLCAKTFPDFFKNLENLNRTV